MEYCDCGDTLDHGVGEEDIANLRAEVDRLQLALDAEKRQRSSLAERNRQLLFAARAMQLAEERLVQRLAKAKREVEVARGEAAEAVEVGGYYARRLIEAGLIDSSLLDI